MRVPPPATSIEARHAISPFSPDVSPQDIASPSLPRTTAMPADAPANFSYYERLQEPRALRRYWRKSLIRII